MRWQEKHRIAALGAVLALVVGGLSTLAFLKARERSRLVGRAEALDRRAAEAKAKIARIPTLRKEVEALSKQIDRYAEILPKEAEVRHEAFMEVMDQFASEVGLVIRKADPVQETKRKARPGKKQTASEKTPFRRHRYRFELEGTFKAFLRFIHRLENWDRFLEIEGFHIRPLGAPEDPGGGEREDKEIARARNPAKTIELVLSTYTYRKEGDEKRPAR